MFGKVASISFAIALATWSAPSQVRAAEAPGANVQLMPVQRDLDIPVSRADASKKSASANDIPTAPLPPALGPGLALLFTIAGVKVIMSAKRRYLRG
jgi:hypothetical protein